MAAFFTNICQWPNCAKKCGSLLELIDHIESTHIESDRGAIEKREKAAASSVNAQSTCTALSYISRFFPDTGVDGRKSSNLLADLGLAPSAPNPVATPAAALAAPSPKRKKAAPRRSSTAATAQADGERDASSATAAASTAGGDGDNGDSDDSWTYQDSMASEEIMKQISLDNDPDKPFICPVQGCAKRYKNVNGMKYHARHGHKSEKKIRKMHKCKCGKSYRSAALLRQHQQAHHHGGDGQGPALDSTMLTPTTTSLASSLDSLAAQASSTPATAASATSSLPQSTRVPITLTQASTKLSLSTAAGQSAAPKTSIKLMPSSVPSSKKLPG